LAQVISSASQIRPAAFKPACGYGLVVSEPGDSEWKQARESSDFENGGTIFLMFEKVNHQ
jgi:hypothetical protein